jgi:dipeptidyl aminopeptidase/acylaminoacyl peptidase
LRLSAWFIPQSGAGGGERAVIVLHGYPYSKADILGVTPFLHEHYDLLLLDLRYFGESEGAITTLGYREWQDVVAAVEYLQSRGVRSIGLWGFSAGAAVALLALPHTAGINAVVADSPFSDLAAMTMDYYRFFPLADRVLAFFTDLLARAHLGVALADVSPLRAAAASRVPIFLIHGERDSTIPIAHFERFRAAFGEQRPGIDTWVVEGAEHGLTYAADRERYEARVLTFLGQHLR